MRRIFYPIFILLLLAKFSQAQNPSPGIIPSFREWKGSTGNFKLNRSLKIIIDPAFYEECKTYASTFSADLNSLIPVIKNTVNKGTGEPGSIYVKKNSEDTSLKKEGYKLSIDDRITIETQTALGAFWATRSILQLIALDTLNAGLPKGIAIDHPQFELRGFVLDCGRKFFSIQFLRDYVKLMSYYKMNDFQIHLNDNGFKQFFGNNWDSTYAAFRLESSTYPALTAKDGSYSKKEFIELQSLARSYGVNIVPEIDVPAHSLAFTRAVPEIGSKQYGMDHLDLDNPKTMQVIDNVFKEYLSGSNPVFTGPDVHIGTDEYAKKDAEKFRAFTDHYIKLVESYGKKARLWGALTHAPGTTPVKADGVTMNLWYNGYADPKEMIQLGYNVISTPDGWLYIVPKAGYYYDYLNLKKIYQEWTPNKIGNQEFEESHPQIKGGSFAVWNDHVGNGITEKDVHDRAFPAVQVLAQKMWNGTKSGQLAPFDTFSKSAGNLGEGPGLNIAGKIRSKTNMILHYDFSSSKVVDKSGNQRNALIVKNTKLKVRGQEKAAYLAGGDSYIETPLTEVGYNYTVSFRIKPDRNNPKDAILFSSENAVFKLTQQQTSNLGFSRENYHYDFNYSVPPDTWTRITVTGNNKGTSLYINGVLKEKLEGNSYVFNKKDKMAKVQTLFFPLRYIGAPEHSFRGYISDLKIYNHILTAKEIADL